MKTFSLALALCVFSGAAIAQPAECQSISKASARLACYDKNFPPIAAKHKARTEKSSTTDQGQVVDGLAEENARLTKKMGNICRGC